MDEIEVPKAGEICSGAAKPGVPPSDAIGSIVVRNVIGFCAYVAIKQNVVGS